MAKTLITDMVLADSVLANGDSLDGEIVNDAMVDDAARLAKAALLRSRIYTLRRLHVATDGETLVLRGRVESFYHKQLAQELVRTAVEGIEVYNAISVVYGRDRVPAAAS